MTKFLSPFFLLLTFTLCFGQNQLKVINKNNHKPISGAEVYCNDDLIGKTNSEGTITFSTKCKSVDIFANNFDDATIVVKKTGEIQLIPSTEKTNRIDRIVISAKSDPKALKLLEEYDKHQKENSPRSLDSYDFNSYSKFSIDVDRDSIDVYKNFLAVRKDSLAKVETKDYKQTASKKKDSLTQEDFINASENSQMFLWEKAAEHKFSKKYGEKTTILDNRMSGFKNPIYEALVLNISNLDKIPKQLKPENRKLYYFYLSDTLQIDGCETYVLKFKEITDKKKQNLRKYNGKIYIDSQTYALKKYESISKKANEGSIVSVWKPVANKWFLDHEDIRIKIGGQSFNTSKKDSIKPGEKPKYNKRNFDNFLYVKNRFFDFKTNVDLKSSEFNGYTLEVKNSDGKLLDKYRTDTLTKRESATYTQIDKFVEKHNFEKKVSFFTQLMRGNLRYKMFDFDLTKFLNYNNYEGFRLGMGVKLNENFNKTFSPDAYFGYGFKDHTWKYGLGLDVKLSDKRTSVFRVEYLDDVFPAGRFSNNLWSMREKLGDLSLDLHNSTFYRNQKFGASFLYDISNSLTMRISANKEKQTALFDYQYKDLGNSFENFSTTLSLKYAPNDKSMMTPSGKLTYEKRFPQFYANYEQGINAFGGNLSYSKVDVMAVHQFRTKLGFTNLKLWGGISSGDTPIWKDFEIAGQTAKSIDHWYSPISSPTNLGFATMPSGTYFANQFVAFKVSQNLPFRFRTIGKRYSSLEVEYQAAIGNMKNRTDHQFNFQVLDHFYQEAGVMWNRFLGRSWSLGLSYRLGYYQTPTFKDNIGIKIKFNLAN